MIDEETFKKWPPILCRLVARDPNRRFKPKTDEELAKEAGMSINRFAWILRQPSWDRVLVKDMLGFLRACNINRSNFWKARLYIRRVLSNQGKEPYHERFLPYHERARIKKILGVVQDKE